MGNHSNRLSDKQVVFQVLAWGVRYALNQGIRLEQIVNDLWLFSTLLQTREIDYSNEVPDLDLLHQQILDYIEDAPTEL